MDTQPKTRFLRASWEILLRDVPRSVHKKHKALQDCAIKMKKEAEHGRALYISLL